jgi:hypothetical protein
MCVNESQGVKVGNVKPVLLQQGSSDRGTVAADHDWTGTACCALVFAFVFTLAVSGCATPTPYTRFNATIEKRDTAAADHAIAERRGTANDVQALFQAVASGQLELVRYYLNKTSANSYVRGSGGDTLLMVAARGLQSSVEIVALLLDGGARINQRDDQGWTALDHANDDSKGFRARRIDRARLLMSRGGVSGKATATSIARSQEAQRAAGGA